MPKLILCIEDEKPVSDAIRATLDLAGFEVATAATAAEALYAARERKPDLILLDLILPDISGFSFFELMRDEALEGIPVIIVSGCRSEDSQYLGRRLGACDYVTKPFKPQDLVDRIRSALGAQKARATLG
jgi:two-component system, OmpR family, response regulator